MTVEQLAKRVEEHIAIARKDLEEAEGDYDKGLAYGWYDALRWVRKQVEKVGIGK